VPSVQFSTRTFIAARLSLILANALFFAGRRLIDERLGKIWLHSKSLIIGQNCASEWQL
jgi:hypothetical protein